MFRIYRAYFQYRAALYVWAAKIGYAKAQVYIAFPWTTGGIHKQARVAAYIGGTDGHLDKQWIEIFRTSNVVVYERIEENAQKLRHGVPIELQNELLRHVRTVASAAVTSETLPQATTFNTTYKTYYDEICSVDVTVWINGQCRGSKVVFNKSLQEAVTEAAQAVVCDSRYKFVHASELQDARFEVFIMPELWLPVTSLDSSVGCIPSTVATRLQSNGDTKGIFVPLLANQMDLHIPQKYFAALQKKANIRDLKKVSFQMCPVLSFIESFDHSQSLILRGTVPKKVVGDDGKSLTVLAHKLASLIDEDGFAAIVTSVQEAENSATDLPRLAFVLHALCEYQTVSGDMSVRDAIVRLHAFIKKVCARSTVHAIVRSYVELAEATPVLQQHFAGNIVTTTPSDSDLEKLQAIKANACSFAMGSQEFAGVKKELLVVYTAWKKERPTANPVVYADLVLTLHWFDLSQECSEVITWLEVLQDPQGSFSSRNVVNTRGVGKIAEACAGVVEAQHITRAALQFLNTMQYTNETMYHIPKSLQETFRYGFRHDHWNRDLWLDGHAHALLALLRLEYFDNYTAHWQTYLQKGAVSSQGRD